MGRYQECDVYLFIMVALAVVARKVEEEWNLATEINSETTRNRSAKNEGLNDGGINWKGKEGIHLRDILGSNRE